ncbi:MAG: SpoIIE family protein phosphatase [Candidatus Brocadiae bacterium]|nr:SpoIIE family protein phosphatase [Candidatus Brocadiia bacterium]
MKLRAKLLLAFSGLMAVAVLGNYLLVSSLGHRAMVEYTLERVKAVTAMVAKVGEYGLRVERSAEELLGEQMIVQAALAAHLVDVAENSAQLPAKDIKERLRDIADSTVLDEFWITDGKAHAYLRNREEIDFTFPSQPTDRNQAWEFWHLLEEDQGRFVQAAMKREHDGEVFKYAGVSGIDTPRIVQVGYNADSLAKFAAGMTAADLVRTLVGGGGIERLVLVTANGRLYIDTNRPGRIEEDELLRDHGLRVLAQKALDTGAPATRMDGTRLVVASPVVDEDGAVYALLSTFNVAPMVAEMRQAVLLTALVTGGVLILGIGLAVHASRGIAAPIEALAADAAQIGQGDLERRVDIQAGGEVKTLANALNKMVASLKGHIQELRRTTVAKERLESEIRVAAKVQAWMMPARLPEVPGLRTFASSVPARLVGGDFYDFLRRPDGRLAIAVGDASGKGLPAALYCAQCLSVLRTLSLRGSDVKDVLSSANVVLLASGEAGGLFATIFYGVYDPQARALHFVNAGHPVPIRVRPGEAPSPLRSEPSLPIGMVDDFEAIEQEATFEPGDLLVLYSDGVTEARNAEGELFGQRRLLECLDRHREAPPEELVERVKGCVREFTGDAELADDLTVVVLHATA